MIINDNLWYKWYKNWNTGNWVWKLAVPITLTMSGSFSWKDSFHQCAAPEACPSNDAASNGALERLGCICISDPPAGKKDQCRLLRNFISFSWLVKIRQREALKTNPHFPSSSDSNWERHQSSKSLRCPASPVSWQEKHLTSFWRAQINWTVWLCGLANVKGGGWKTQH